MRSSVEPRRFELMSDVGERSPRCIAEGNVAASDEPIDVEHSEPDALHVKRSNREFQRFAFLEDGVLRRAWRLALQMRDQNLQTVFGGFAVIGISCHCANLASPRW